MGPNAVVLQVGGCKSIQKSMMVNSVDRSGSSMTGMGKGPLV